MTDRNDCARARVPLAVHPAGDTVLVFAQSTGSGGWRQICSFDIDDMPRAKLASAICEALCVIDPSTRCQLVNPRLGAGDPLKTYSAAEGWRFGL